MPADDKNIIQNLAAEITEYPYFHEIEHKHLRFEVRCFVKADAQMLINGVFKKIKSGDTVVITPGKSHRLDSAEKICFVTFFGIDKCFQDLNSDPLMVNFNNIIQTERLNEITDTVYRELAAKNVLFAERLAVLRNEFAVELLRSCSIPASDEKSRFSGHKLVTEVNEYINTRFKEKIRLDDIADFVGFNKSYLARIYKKNTGYTVWKRIGFLRSEYAKHLLETSSESIEEISQMCGFENNSYFRNLFKSHTGLTPAAYRRKFKI